MNGVGVVELPLLIAGQPLPPDRSGTAYLQINKRENTNIRPMSFNKALSGRMRKYRRDLRACRKGSVTIP